MRKRRKAKVVWLPQDLDNRLGTAPATATSGEQSSTIIRLMGAPGLSAPPENDEIPIVKDFAGGLGGLIAKTDTTLADIEQTGYRLRRIVGKLYFQVLQQDRAVGDPSIFLVTAAFIIRGVAQDGQSMASAAGNIQINTAKLNSTMDPWIWRRSWILANRSQTALANDINAGSFPEANVVYGAGIFDGPHVDAKTARIVGPEERLFLDVTVEGINGNAEGAQGAIMMIGDLRVLASMRSNTGNRRNAAR